MLAKNKEAIFRSWKYTASELSVKKFEIKFVAGVSQNHWSQLITSDADAESSSRCEINRTKFHVLK